MKAIFKSIVIAGGLMVMGMSSAEAAGNSQAELRAIFAKVEACFARHDKMTSSPEFSTMRETDKEIVRSAISEANWRECVGDSTTLYSTESRDILDILEKHRTLLLAAYKIRHENARMTIRDSDDVMKYLAEAKATDDVYGISKFSDDQIRLNLLSINYEIVQLTNKSTSVLTTGPTAH